MIKKLAACFAVASMTIFPLGSLLAESLSENGKRPLPSAFGYEPKDEDERGLWLQMDDFETKIKYSKLLIDDPALNAYLRKTLCNTVGSDRCASTRIYLMRTPFFNASMAPNGMMMVWSGLLLRVRSEAELASVLAHEFGHFENQHSLQSFRDLRAKTDAMAWFSLVPGVGNLAQISLVGSAFRFNREMEREADIVAINYMAQSGYDPVAASTIWQQLRGEMDATAKARKQKSLKDSDGGFFATHPNTKERMDYLREAAEKKDAKRLRKGEAEYREVVKDWWPRLIDDQIKLNDFGATEFLLEQLASNGWTSELLFARGELHRSRGNAKDFAVAIGYYRQAIAKGETIPEAWRGLGLALLRSGAQEDGKAALRKYLAGRPNADDRAIIAAMARAK
jgi:hypothetical protein